MSRVIRTDEQLALLTKPSLQPIASLGLGADDQLIVCAGFEDRALVALRTATTSGGRFNVTVIEYLPPVRENRIDEVLRLCADADLPIERLTYDRQDPTGFGEMLAERAATIDGRLFIDVSGMSRLLIAQIIVALRQRGVGLRNSYVVYAEAQMYPPSKAEVEEAIQKSDLDPFFAALFLSCGVFSVTVVPELSPLSLGGNQSRLVVFPSFNADQMTALRAELQPSRLTFVHGVPPNPQNAWRVEAITRLNRIEPSMNSENFNTSTLDYRETLDCLLEIYQRHGIRDRLLVSPTGSKMQAVAVGLFKAFVNDVQIVYPTPREFRSPTNYTTGVRQMYLLSLGTFSSIE